MRIDLRKRGPLLLFITLLAYLLLNGLSHVSQDTDFKDYFEASKNFRIQKDLYDLDVLEELTKELKSGKLNLNDILKPEIFLRLQAKMDNVGAYIYPPTFAFLLIPLSFSEYEVSSAVFFCLNFGALVASLLLIGKFLKRDGQFLFLTAVVLLCFRFIENHQNNNQVGFILIFLILSSVTVKKDWLAGLLLALAIVIKITPAVFLFYFLVKRRYSVLFYALGFGALWAFLPAFFEPSFTWNMNQTWYELVLEKYLKSPAIRAWKNNQSLSSTLAKYFLQYADIMNQGRFGMPLVELTLNQIKWIGNILSIGIAAPYLYRAYKGASDGFLLSGLFFFSVLFSGISWIHAFVFLLFPTAFALSGFWPRTERFPNREEWKSLFGKNKSVGTYLILSFAVLLLNRAIIGSAAEELLMMFSFLFYISVIQYFCIFFIESKNNSDPKSI
ncbi:PF09594 family protein [Leptospira inadai serovar Lyme str. 10]|uniref:PF09594 family protein n=2 Tax=Leptospira inadai serovar Lyme TaxID=293084 RepID=V6HA42_9LEPT|nr:glycosyltransferase family 87 protein [Leptospira inadai]EQA35962.1 PF09594 family protein [Leptospira inadai serovar Lyme str. 10]PNV76891.1 DUF2029 domain-containing protein [Leptospira inadai serovar Lyme]